MWSLHTRGYDSAFKRKEILTHVATWMEVEGTLLSEVSQSLHLYEVSKEDKFVETYSRIVVTRGFREGKLRSYLSTGAAFQFEAGRCDGCPAR